LSKAPSPELSDWPLDWLSDDPQEADTPPEPGSQHQPFEISSDSEPPASDGEPRRSGRTKKVTRAVQSQQEQIELGLIPAPGARAKTRALNTKKKNIQTSQLKAEFELI
jgi:hypothetical protein